VCSNTTENCAELIHYYTTRPQLLEYTVDTELSRMDYLVISPYDQFVNKDEIKLYVESTSDQRDSTEDLIWRASNQSLLADLIAALTGDDRLIRQSMMVTAVADACKFELNLVGGDGSNRGVAVMSDLVLSIPYADGIEGRSRLELGKVKARVLFVPEKQELNYSIVSAHPLVSPDDDRLWTAAAALERDLADLGIGDAAMPAGPHVDQLSRRAHDDLRDQFLATVSTGASGLSSAFRELDSVTNVSGKLGWLRSAMPSLPTAEAIAQAESEAASARGVPTTHDQQGAFPRPSSPPDNVNRGRGFLDRLVDEGQPPAQQAPLQPATRAMGFLDRLVNELEAPAQQQSQYPRPPPPAPTNSNPFSDHEYLSQPPEPLTHADEHRFHPAPIAPVPAAGPTPSKAPLIGGFLVRGLANAAKGLAEAAVAADEVAEAQYARPNQQKDDGDMDESGCWSDDDDIAVGDEDEELPVGVTSPPPVAAPTLPMGNNSTPLSQQEQQPSLTSFAERLSQATKGSMAPAPTASVSKFEEPQAFHRPFQNMPTGSPALPSSLGGASVSTCDGSYQFVSMTSLEKELPVPKDWLAVEAVDAVDDSGIIPTRTRWKPRQMRA